jgi:hypothetical protein
MTVEDYKQQITLRIKDNLNQWIDKLKTENPDLLLTKQWKVLFPEGFKPRFNSLPVVTNAKLGKHLVAEVDFVLPESLELDLDSLELNLKNEPFPESKKVIKHPVLLDNSLDTLNNLIIGLNEFMQGFKPIFSGAAPTAHTAHTALTAPLIPASPIRTIQGKTTQPDIIRVNSASDIDAVRRQLLQSEDLPEWFKTINSREIREQLLQKIAETLIHYRQQVGREVDLGDFFRQYTNQLLKAGRLYHYCKYKGKAIQMDDEGLCMENYCSKKPFRSACSQVTLRFGSESV